jgi:hypothetical protein
MHPRVRLLFGFILQTLFRARVSLLLAQTIDRAPAGQRHHPAERFSLLGRKIFRLVPDLHKNFLQEIVGLSFVVNHAKNKRFQNAIVSIVKLRKCLRIRRLDRPH